MPSGFRQHQPARPLRDALVRQQDYARKAARALPYSGRQWQAIRRMVLDREPLCRDCMAPATDVDHIDNDNANNALANLAAMCKSCHSRKTRREMNEKSRATESSSTALRGLHAWPRIGPG